MDTTRSHLPQLLGAGMLLVAALLGNLLSVPLFFGVDFLFGSVAVLIAVRLLGPVASTLIAALAGLYTLYLWGHPYALVIFTLEAAVVGLLQRRLTDNLLLADLIYWLCCGAPLIWLFYGQLMGLDTSRTLLIVLKQPINGLFNAILATFVLMALPRRWLQWFPAMRHRNRLALSDLMFSLLLATAFLPALTLSVFQTRATLAKLEATLASDLQVRAHMVNRYLAERSRPLDLRVLQRRFTNDYPHYGVTLLAPSGQVLLDTSHPADAQRNYLRDDTRSLGVRLRLWLPPRHEAPFMLWWKQARYFIVLPVRNADVQAIVLSQTSAPLISRLDAQHTETFILLIIVTLIGALVSALISHLFTRPIRALSRLTHALPDKLEQGLPVDWPESRIRELHSLARDTHTMAASLGQTLQAQRQSQELLELRVAERTASLKEGAARTQAIIENAVEGIVSIDERGSIESFNPMAEKLFGYQAVEVIGHNINMLMPEPYRSQHDGYIRQYLHGGPAHIIGSVREVVGLRKDGSRFDFELSISEVKLRDRRIFTGFVRDISERKANEKLKEELIANVSHELRTPLTAIRGAIGLLANGAAGELPDQAREMIQITQHNSERLHTLIDDILDIQKLEAGGVALHPQLIALLPLIERNIEENRPYAAQHTAQIVLQSTLPPTTTLVTDPVRLNQVLTNLMSNAAKFSPQDSGITVSLDARDDSVRISVADQGPGVPEDFRPLLFGKFSQADGSATRKRGGTGLGLHISRSLIELMGGRIGYEPGENGGAVFFIELPLSDAPSAH